jgi:Smg protein
MKENVLDVLVYLFENFLYVDDDASPGRAELEAGLSDAGFADGEIGKAFAWLDALDAPPAAQGATRASGPVRVFAERERDCLDVAALGFLLELEQHGVLDAPRRELVLDRVLALDHEALDVDDVKWIVLMVLSRQPGHEAACAWMESRLLAGEGEALH